MLIRTTAVLAMEPEPDALIQTTAELETAAELVLVPVLLLAELATEPDALIRTTAEPVQELAASIRITAELVPVQEMTAARPLAATTLAKSLS